jgi:hypothetical protein
LTVSGTFSALPRAPPGKVWILKRPPERSAIRSAKAFDPISINGPPGQPVAIFQL